MTRTTPPASFCFVIMGVSGCGKTAVGRAVSERLGGLFVDADDHHSPDNIAKMAAGTPLTDADRQPWLDRLHEIIARHLAQQGLPLVLACSALRRRHRDRLRGRFPPDRLRFVHLTADFVTILARLDARQDHFMQGQTMLEDQCATLEPLAADELAAGSMTVEATGPVTGLVHRIATLAARARGDSPL
jgi:gluconokinase